ncbi:MAG: GYD domain-containing protein [Candidatus Natronoplasma sp.]
MNKYVVLSDLTDEGRKTIMEKPERIKEVNKELEAKGAKIVEQYALLGQYDFITILEAPSKGDIYKTVTEVASRGSIDTVTLPAMEIEELINKMQE